MEKIKTVTGNRAEREELKTKDRELDRETEKGKCPDRLPESGGGIKN